MRRGARKTDAHVVGDARFAGRVDLERREFRHEDARLQTGAALEADLPPGVEEFVDAVENVEIDDAGDRQSRLARQPGELRRRIAIGVVGEEGVGVEIDVGSATPQTLPRRARRRATDGSARPPAWRGQSRRAGAQVVPSRSSPFTARLSASSRNHKPPLSEGRTLPRSADHGASASDPPSAGAAAHGCFRPAARGRPPSTLPRTSGARGSFRRARAR